MAQRTPASFFGYGRKHELDNLTRGGLVNVTFSSRCPPDVQPNSRIIGLCGTTDFTGTLDSPPDSGEDTPSSGKKKASTLLTKGKELLHPTRPKERKKQEKEAKEPKSGVASPQADGWFVSDFYLFNHLFRGLGANQLWITCESPRNLVRKYKVYGHGQAKGDHRVVLNEALLPAIEQAGTMRVFTRKALLEDFLRTFKSECQMAAAPGQPVLLLVFGHGDPNSYGIAIGGHGQPTNAPRLTIPQIAGCLRGLNVSVTLLLTSCYSGGWVLQPQLNVSALTAAGPEMESESQFKSIGGRFHGSLYATAVRLAFTEMENERITQIHPRPTERSFDEELLSSTYAELTNTIHYTLLHDVDKVGGKRHDIQFSAQDDEWESEWRKRSGIPLAQFGKVWADLPVIPAQQAGAVGATRTAALEFGQLSLTEAITGRYGHHWKLNKEQSLQATKHMAHGYLTSFPGKTNIAGNHMPHKDATDLVVKGELEDWRLENLQHTLHYRLESMKLASFFKDTLQLDFVDCADFELESWVNSVLEEERKSPGKKHDTYLSYLAMIQKAGIFGPPIASAGYRYNKPRNYLAAAMVELGYDVKAVDKAIATLLATKTMQVKALTERVRIDRTIRKIGEKAFSTIGKRMRSASPPRKRAPIPSFSEVMG